MKKWIDASIIAETESLNKELWELEKLMKEKPNFNKTKFKYKENKKIKKPG